jgi:glycine/D-amino acid oxidase-like deaminating enzyme
MEHVMNRRTFLQGAAALPGLAAAVSCGRPRAGSDSVVVVGAGIVGASIGYHLAKRGARVTILEKDKPASAATGTSFAYLNASRKRPRPYYDLNLLGIDNWRRLQLEIGSELKIQWGGGVEWHAPGDAADKLRDGLRSYQQWGYPARHVDEAGLRRLLPNIKPGPVGAAAFYEDEGGFDAVPAVDVLLRKAREFGATVTYPAEVTGLDVDGDRVRGVRTKSGDFEAGTIVLAAGIGTQQLARLADVNVPLGESSGVLVYLPPQPALLGRVVFSPAGSFKQNPDGRIVSGGGAEGATPEATRAQGQKALENAAQYLPQLKGLAAERVAVGHRVLPRDGFPIIGLSPKHGNLYIAATHSGITLAPIIGSLASLEILEGISVDLLEPWRPARFAKG